MENNHNIEQFDSMLKQSLENTQIPVPSGVWQSVGSAIGTNTTVAAKISVIKILSLKYITAALVSGAMIWGTYELINKNDDSKTLTSTNNIIEEKLTVAEEQTEVQPTEKAYETNNMNQSNKPVSQKITPVYDTTVIGDKKDDSKPDSAKQNNEKNKFSPKKENNNITAKEPENKYTNPEKDIVKNNEEESEESKTDENKYSSENIVIPNAFTPYEIDGFNDCYRVLIENETRFILQIFDNNRKKVFETTDKNKCWDGKNMTTGEMCLRGAYSYKLIYELNSGYKKTERGLINLF